MLLGYYLPARRGWVQSLPLLIPEAQTAFEPRNGTIPKVWFPFPPWACHIPLFFSPECHGYVALAPPSHASIASCTPSKPHPSVQHDLLLLTFAQVRHRVEFSVLLLPPLPSPNLNMQVGASLLWLKISNSSESPGKWVQKILWDTTFRCQMKTKGSLLLPLYMTKNATLTDKGLSTY